MVLEKYASTHWFRENLVSKNSFFNNYFEELRYYLNPVFQYKQGNCHNVAHYASLILNSYGVSHRKIWLYAPCRYLDRTKTSIKLPDPNKISQNGLLSWGFHVAILIENEGLEYVFDYFIDEEKPITIDEWIARINLKSFFLEIEKPENYLFFTDEKEGAKKGVFNGKYFGYDGFCRENNWIEKGLAINETAIQFYKNEFYHFNYSSTQSFDYRLLAGSVNNFECVFRDKSTNSKMTLAFQEKHQIILHKYKLIYEENLEKWIEKVAVFL